MNGPGTIGLDFAARLSDVHHTYGSVDALRGVSLDVPTGAVTGIIGPDGVGKSTILSLMSGVRSHQRGDVRVLGGDISVAKHRWRMYPRLAFMPQGLGRNLYSTLSVFENIDFFARLFGIDREERRRRIDRLTDHTGLKPFQDRAAEKLSGGMKQKLGLCCALVHVPDLLILDEPTTGIDPLSRQQFWALIDRIREDRDGLSVVVSTAHLPEARRFDRIVAMNDGKVIGRGSPDNILEETETETLGEAFVSMLSEQGGGSKQKRVDRTGGGPEAQSAIEANELTRRFGDFTAVDGVSFKIRRGEIFGFIGPNGSGKTTTMKMLTGLLSPTTGTASVFGQPVDGFELSNRERVGYMAQDFSLYDELTVRRNLQLHARLYGVPEKEVNNRVEDMIERFDFGDRAETVPESLPIGQRQRLSLAVAMVHEPELLILDEPTSGVDPMARNEFWERLIVLSRDQDVTIFISTHYMSEAERCDRITLMHEGRALATDRPEKIKKQQVADSLEDAFVKFVKRSGSEETRDVDEASAKSVMNVSKAESEGSNKGFSIRRLWCYVWRESVGLSRDPVRLTMALLGSIILLFVIGYGVTMDVDDLTFAVLDWDQTSVSRNYGFNISGSPYFIEKPPIRDYDDMETRLRSGELGLALEIPPGFAGDLDRGRSVEIGGWVDASMPQRAETIRGYVRGMHTDWINQYRRQQQGLAPPGQPVSVETRYRYNPDIESLVAIVPGVIPILLVLVPSMLMALSVVREKERGTIVNFFLTPTTRLEFVMGKQVPYLVVSLLSLLLMTLLAVTIFGLSLKGSLLALLVGGFFYVVCSTSMGLLMSAFMRSQVAAIFSTAILTMIPAIQYSGLITPMESLEGMARLIGLIYPTTYFLKVSRGAFAKGLSFNELSGFLWPLVVMGPVLILITVSVLRKQEG